MSVSGDRTVQEKLSVVSFNCHGFNNGLSYLPILLESFDVILLQEHWLSQSDLSMLCFDGFITTAISGFDDSAILHGRPFGGCAILYRQCLISSITQLKTGSNRFCAVKIDFCGCTCLLVNVYLPTDYRSVASSALFKDTLGELAGFVSATSYDFVVVVGDWNTDVNRSGSFTDIVLSFLSDLDMSFADLDYRDDVSFTYIGHDGNKSWLDHVAVTNHFRFSISSVHTIKDGRNLSDHNPLAFFIDLSSVSVTSPPSGNNGPLINWRLATPESICDYQGTVQQLLERLSINLTDEVVLCCNPTCSVHQNQLEDVCANLVSGLRDAARTTIPSSRSGRRRRIAGWSQLVKPELDSCRWWYNLWLDAGSPSAGVLFQLKKRAHRRYKYAVRRARRREEHTKQTKLAEALLNDPTCKFWSEVRRCGGSHQAPSAPVIDGVSGSENISNLWCDNFKQLYNSSDGTASTNLLEHLVSTITADDFKQMRISSSTVKEAIGKLKRGKSDGGCLVSDHIINAPPVICHVLSRLFTAILRHGFMPSAIRDAIIQPIPKGSKDPSQSANYRGIALASSLSKVLEWSILLTWNCLFSTSNLQFGFKSGYSTILCSGVLKAVANHYLSKGSKVYACLIDASKAFDTVDHGILFQKLLDRNMPKPLVRLLLQWYKSQQLSVRWLGQSSSRFQVTNGVRQGGVLSPILFTIYLDSLLESLRAGGRGCYWRSHFAGALCYADDLTVLAPSPDALRKMLAQCEAYAQSHGIRFNVSKTQLICFRRTPYPVDPSFTFCGQSLPLSDSVLHLGNTLHCTLSDKEDIRLKTMAFLRKANSVLFRFSFADRHIKMRLFQAFCSSFYGCSLWRLDCSELKSLNVAYNNIIRKIWSLPRNSRTGIVHSLGLAGSVYHIIYFRFLRFRQLALYHPSALIRSIFTVSSATCNSNFIGFNFLYGHTCCKSSSPEHTAIGNLIREVRSNLFVIPGFSENELNDIVSYTSVI